MKKLFLILAATSLAAGLAACSDDTSEGTGKPVVADYAMRSNGGNVLVNLSASAYDVDIPAEATAWIHVNEAESAGKTLVLLVDENRTGAERSAVVTVTRAGSDDLLATVNVAQSDVSLRAGEFVIEEIYFTGTPFAETGTPETARGDQYIKVRNNTGEDLYADGMLLILASGLMSGQNLSFPDGDFRTQVCAGSAFYRIPGGGHDVLVKAGESLVIVNNAQNHTVGNPDSWDATKADFEWFDVSSNDNFLDLDNPDVANLDKWYAQTLTVHTLHDRGFKAVAIAMPPAGMTGEEFLAQYALQNGTYVFHSPNGSDYPMTLTKCYGVPNAWVLDAVNTGCRDAYFTAPWDASLDAGYAWCGVVDGDPDRYGKAVIRKTGSDGKLVDTNNSTNDFTSNTTPSMLAK